MNKTLSELNISKTIKSQLFSSSNEILNKSMRLNNLLNEYKDITIIDIIDILDAINVEIFGLLQELYSTQEEVKD